MAYNLKYTCSFSSVETNTQSYLFEIYEKDYTGVVVTDLTGAAVPILHSWDEDDPRAPIRGSSLQFNCIGIPIQEFYAIADDHFKGRLTWNNHILFEGFLVQDDCIELLADYPHEVTLSFTDGLGLLKDIALNQAITDGLVERQALSASISFNAPHQLIFIGQQDTIFVSPGDKVEVIGTTQDGIYTVTAAQLIGTSSWVLTVAETVTQRNTIAGTIRLFDPIGVTAKFRLLDIVKGCMQQTNLQLPFHCNANIFESTQIASISFLETTYVSVESFLKDDDNFLDCYQVLEALCRSFNMSVFQSYGSWNMVRWDEHSYTAPLTWQYFKYRPDFTPNGRFMYDFYMQAGIGEAAAFLNGATQRILRPFEYAREQFDYVQPRALLRNANLQKLGALRTTYMAGGNQVKEYDFMHWKAKAFITGNPATTFIRVITNSAGEEIDRYAVVKGAVFDNIRAVESLPVEVTAGDIVTFSFSYRTAVSRPGPVQSPFAVELRSGTNQYYVRRQPVDGYWQIGAFGTNLPNGESQVGYYHEIPRFDNNDQWHTVTIKTTAAPVDGLMYLYLNRVAPSNVEETFYKDISLTIEHLVANSRKAKGHVHKTSQPVYIKNNSDFNVKLDDSPSNAVSGTLFLPSRALGIQQRTKQWVRNGITAKLGQLVTYETLEWRRRPRQILEGTLRGLTSGELHVCPLARWKYTYWANLNYLMGRLEIDYRNAQAVCTLWEQHDDNENFSTLLNEYTFTYIYATK